MHNSNTTISIKKAIIVWMAFLLFPLMMQAQATAKWDKTFPNNIRWQELNYLGNLVLCSDDALMGIDAEDGAVRWTKNEFAGLDRQAYNELTKSPFFTIKKDNTIYLIDQLSGDEVFNSTKAGIAEISDYFLLYNSDAILVAGKDAGGEPIMLSVQMSKGKLSWTMNEKFGHIIAVNELGNDELLIITLFNNYKLKAGSGEIIWKVANSKEAEQVGKMGALGALMMAAAENMAGDMDIKLRFFRKPGSDVFYLGSEQEQQSTMSSSSGEPSISYTNNYNAYRISDGSRVWESDLEMKGKLGQLAFLDNGLLIMPDDGNRTKINLFDYESASGLWGKKGKGIAVKGGIYDYLDSGDGILLVSRTNNNDFLNYLDPKTGTITFEKPLKVDGSVVGIVPLEKAILYITDESMNILDPMTGSLKWKKSIETRPELTAEDDGKIYAFDAKTAQLKVIDKATEEVKPLSTMPIEFQGKEVPRRLEVMEDGIFLHSDQNVAKIDFSGQRLFVNYYPAPREPGWKRALLYAEGIRAAYIGATSYYVSGVMAAAEDDVRAQDEVSGELVSQLGDAYGDLGDQAVGYAGAAFKQANARLKATTSGRDFMIIMSTEEKEVVLLQVSKNTGEVMGKIALGKDREPNYAVDDITGQVYYLVGDKELKSYIFN